MPALDHAPPGPRGNWLLGSVSEFRRDVLGFLTRCAREFGDVSSFRLGPRRLVLLNHPDLIHRVLVADNHRYVKSFNYRLLKPFLGNGLLLNEGADWLKQRRLLQPHFLRQRLLGYAEPTARLAERFTAGWKQGERRDLHADMMRLTLQIVSRVILGVDTDADAETVERALDVLMLDYKHRFETGVSLPRWLPTPGNWRVRRAVLDLRGVIGRMIAHRRANPGERDDLLSRMVAAQDKGDVGMSDRQMRYELLTMLLAGHETTANTLTWTFDLLARHPEAEAELVRELREVLGDQPPSARNFDRLTFTEKVLLESMRLYPTAYLIGRQAVEEVEVGGFRLPAGSTLLMSQWVMHRDPRFFSRPDEFLPQRWAEGPRGLPGLAYFPFGAGPRLCIGSQFAMMEATVILAAILPRFRLRLAGNAPTVPWASVTLRPRDGLSVLVERREPLTPPGASSTTRG